MTASHKRRKARIRKYRKPLLARKADCFAHKCHQPVTVYRHVGDKTFPLCASHHEGYRALRRKISSRSDYDLMLSLESL